MHAAAGSGKICIVGGGDLAGQFYDGGFPDEPILQVGAVSLGMGKPLFPRRVLSPVPQLRSVRQIGTSMVGLHYAILCSIIHDEMWRRISLSHNGHPDSFFGAIIPVRAEFCLTRLSGNSLLAVAEFVWKCSATATGREE